MRCTPLKNEKMRESFYKYAVKCFENANSRGYHDALLDLADLQKKLYNPYVGETTAFRALATGTETYTVLGELFYDFSALAESAARVMEGKRPLISDIMDFKYAMWKYEDGAKRSINSKLYHGLALIIYNEDGSKQEGLKILSEIKKELVRELFASNKYMLLMIQNVLTKYKYDNNSMKINKKICNLTVDVQKIINDLKYIFENKKLNVVFESEQNFEFAFDEIEIKRVLNNLFANAIEHSAENSTIEATLTEKNNEVVFKISNKSKNFSDENLKNIFNKYTTDITHTGKIGFGLGLFICKEIIEAHDGKIRAYVKGKKDSDNEKIVFEFKLPKTLETKRESPF